ncbi:type I restriction-modification system endonuclease [Sediminibacterium ginsengisoli]|uniref:Type I restriction enzyme, R subunit n=1 Tax=Sediminibacterium ginsengisoli TaxID=413434 RepID=A0A1T4QDE2_9BACT|nr:type I restriction-modification system endonuclease [Sediminibacterium ginsengisoli]SKA01258.1 type I restriction enzyme, R subunit [Sediminibacterium ginsengisoli]
MAPSNFIYLEQEFPLLCNIGKTAEYYLYNDPVVCLIKLRQLGEKISEHLFEEHKLAFPWVNTFHNRIKILEEQKILSTTVSDIFFLVKKKGNAAAHEGTGTFDEAKSCLYAAFQLSKWFCEIYSSRDQSLDQVKFILPEDAREDTQLKQLEMQYAQLEAAFNKLLEERHVNELSEEKRATIRQRATRAAAKISMSEAETRALIDEQLKNAGWLVNTETLNYKKHKTLPQRGKNIAIAEWPSGPNWVDYALFIGCELYGFVEAKKYGQDISTDLRQAKVYAELVEADHEAILLGAWDRYKVPFLFSTNGRPYLEQIKTKSGIWFLDVREKTNNARPLQGWYSPEGLIKLREKDIQQANQKLLSLSLDFLESKSGLGLRAYQLDAIRAVEHRIVTAPDNHRALVAMATGTGKTRTIIGLCYHLIQANRFNRILFLVDRNLLGTQAINAFKDNKVVGLNTFAEIYDVKELKEKMPEQDTRLHFSTVQSMVKRLFYKEDDGDVLPVDQYDCIIIDEAHRGYLMDKEMDDEELVFKDQNDYVSKYRMVLDYFDAYAIGLTATPALHTTEIFGAPVYFYSYREAVIDGYLIDHEPPHQIETTLSKEGITWEKGEKPKAYDQEENSIIELEALEDELHFDVSAFNKLVLSENFNRTVVAQLAKALDPEGDAKTLVFAATDEHADTLVHLFKEEYSRLGIDVPDNAIQKITGKSYNPQELLNCYKNEQFPNIAVTVDLLTTGIDVPRISNLVFMRRVKSRILYEQMLGRATRKCDDINKEFFQIYDAVGLYETLSDYTQMKPVSVNAKASFQQLSQELDVIRTQERVKKQIEQIIAKLQRKRRYIEDAEDAASTFKYYAEGNDTAQFIDFLKNQLNNPAIQKTIQGKTGLWKFLDEFKPAPAYVMVSEHADEYIETTRGYGKGSKPEDYLDSFTNFIKNNLNQVAALSIVCNRPKELDRKSLKELLMILDAAGFNTVSLRTAWKQAKNEDIAADIISFIRTLAIGTSLESHEDRIKRAMKQVRNMKQWNAVQSKWLDRFEKQLLKETILQIKDLDDEPFKEEGGFQRLDKIFEHQLQVILDTINDNLYAQSA